MEPCVFVQSMLISLALVTATTAKCSDKFKAFRILEDGQTGEEMSDICLEEFGSKETSEFSCKSFRESNFERSLLPSVFKQSDSVLSVEKPSDLVLYPAQHEFVQRKTYIVSSLNITWESPYSDLAKQEMEGFIFYYDASKSDAIKCRLLLMNSSKAYIEQKWVKIRYSYKINIVPYNDTISTEVYTVPTPTGADYKSDLVLTADVTTAPLIDVAKSGPGNWTPSVGLTPGRNGLLTLRFSLSPEIYNLTVFSIYLMKLSFSEVDYYNSTVLYTQVADGTKDVEEYQFEGLESDQYRVAIRPHDSFKGIKGKCLCWILEGNEKYCKMNCESVWTQWVNLTDGFEEPGLEKIAVADAQGSSDTDTVLIASAIGCTLVVGVTLATGIFFWRYRQEIKDGNCFKKKSSAPIKTISQRIGLFASPWDTLGPSTLTHKTVYILYSEDNEAHIEYTNALATFLNVHCYCNVIYRPWCKLAPGQDGHSWLVSNMNSADLVLFVASEGAQMLIQAEMSKQVYKGRSIGPEGDLFLLGVKRLRLISCGSLPQQRVVAVHTGSQRWCQELLLFPIMYQLPTDLPDLLQKIHHLSPAQAKEHNMKIPLSVKALPEIPEGKQLLSALTASQKYRNENPTWFKDRFGSPLPILTPLQFQLSSTDSDYGSLSPGQSVSSQNLNSSDFVGSPCSVFGGPDFKAYLNRMGSTKSNPESRQRLSSMHTNDCESPEKMKTVHGNTAADEISMLDSRSVVTVPSTAEPASRIKPPEEISQVGTDILSHLLRDVNSSKGWTSPSSTTCNNSALPPDPANLPDIKPPVLCSDMTSDCISLGFKQINDHAVGKSEPRNQDLKNVMDDDHSAVNSAFDTISV